MGKNGNIAFYFHVMKKVDPKALKFPIGEFKMPEKFSEKEIVSRIKTIENFPAILRKEVEKLDDKVFLYRHRLGGWTIKQLVHHCADSHLNAYVRTKLACTEKNPTIKPYDESAWANMDDAAEAPVEWSLKLLEGLHKRWAIILTELTPEDFKKTYFHPEQKRKVSLVFLVFLYSWHCNHHLAHIKQAKKYKNKFS